MTPTPQSQSIEENKNLKDLIEHELYEMLRLTSMMQPKSDVEFIAVALPNLHIAIHKHIEELLHSHTQSVREEVISYIGQKEGWEESEDVYREHFGLPTKYTK